MSSSEIRSTILCVNWDILPGNRSGEGERRGTLVLAVNSPHSSEMFTAARYLVPAQRALARLIVFVTITWLASARAEILWSHPSATLAHETGRGADVLHGAVRRDDSSSDTLYFRLHVDPLSDASTEEYFAGFQFFEKDAERLGVGNSVRAWAYSAFFTAEQGQANQVFGDVDLHSARPESYQPGNLLAYELPRRGIACVLVFKVQFIAGGPDMVTVWMNPKLKPGATEENQSKSLTTKFKANVSFDEIRLRHIGVGRGWIFSDMAIGTSFGDFIVPPFWQRWWFVTLALLSLLVSVGAAVRFVEKRKFQLQLQHAQQERALERERTRIAQDLHDDLGSSLTRISLLSGLLQADKDNPDQVAAHAAKICQSADQTVRALEEIVWAVRPGSDSLQSLIEYVSHFANEMFEGDTARCRLDLPHDLPARPLPPDVRHNIFLVVKEALTNALKHAGANEVRLQGKITGNQLEILVQDDGRGFDTAAVAGGRNGLGNMQRRAEAIGGRLTLRSEAGKGTTVRLVVELPNGVVE